MQEKLNLGPSTGLVLGVLDHFLDCWEDGEAGLWALLTLSLRRLFLLTPMLNKLLQSLLQLRLSPLGFILKSCSAAKSRILASLRKESHSRLIPSQQTHKPDSAFAEQVTTQKTSSPPLRMVVTVTVTLSHGCNRDRESGNVHQCSRQASESQDNISKSSANWSACQLPWGLERQVSK